LRLAATAALVDPVVVAVAPPRLLAHPRVAQEGRVACTATSITTRSTAGVVTTGAAAMRGRLSGPSRLVVTVGRVPLARPVPEVAVVPLPRGTRTVGPGGLALCQAATGPICCAAGKATMVAVATAAKPWAASRRGATVVLATLAQVVGAGLRPRVPQSAAKAAQAIFPAATETMPSMGMWTTTPTAGTAATVSGLSPAVVTVAPVAWH
jgi:hypothetical protein